MRQTPVTALGNPPQPQRPRVLLCGYYGEHNLGDDALLQVLLTQLPEGIEPLVTAADGAAVTRLFGVDTVDRRQLSQVLRALQRCRALVLGGGSLLQDSTSFRSLIYYGALIVAARLRGLPILLWGQGLGPLRRRRSQLLARGLLAMATSISWRDPASADLAAGWGIAGRLGSDPVWDLAPRSWAGRGGPIVLCWRPVAGLEPDGWRLWLEAVADLAEGADRPVLWLPFHREQDSGLFERLATAGLLPASLADRSRSLSATDLDGAMAVFAAAGLVLAMRLHGLILAAQSGSPCAALSYDPKVAAAAAGIGCPCHDLAQPAPSTLVAQWRGVLDQPPSSQRLDGLRAAARSHRLTLEPLRQLG
jgi:polysaccharide pyruvyl transferase CsaB